MYFRLTSPSLPVTNVLLLAESYPIVSLASLKHTDWSPQSGDVTGEQGSSYNTLLLMVTLDPGWAVRTRMEINRVSPG